MFGRSKRRQHALPGRGKKLGFECLESRQMLSGIVQAQLVGDVLTLTEDATFGPASNTVQVQQGLATGQFIIRGTNNTLLRVDGSLTSETTYNGVSHIDVNLGLGDDKFELKGTVSAPALLMGNVTITNNWGSNTNSFDNALIQGTLTVGKVAGTFSTSILTVQNTTVAGPVTVNNVGAAPGGGGDTSTMIVNCRFENSLTLTNGNGNDLVTIQDSLIDRAAAAGSTLTNGAGGSRVYFIATGTTPGNVFYGDLTIDNGANPIGVPGLPQLDDLIGFTRTEVKGQVQVNNNDGDSRILVQDDSKLGTNLPAGTSGPLVVNNGPGVDKFEMKNSEAPWGVVLIHGAAPDLFGSTTEILQDSKIGTHPAPPAPAVLGLSVTGDAGNDTVTVRDTTIVGPVNLPLSNGFNTVVLENNKRAIDALTITTGTGIDKVTIKGTSGSPQSVYFPNIALGDGNDELILEYLRLIGPGTLNADGGADSAVSDKLRKIGVEYLGGPINELWWNLFEP